MEIFEGIPISSRETLTGKQTIMDWQGHTDGTPWMQRQLIALLSALPLQFIYAVVALVVPGYLVFRPGARHQYRFFRHQLGFSPLKAARMTVVNHYRFGQIMIDRFAAFAGRKFRFTIEGEAHFDHLVRQPESFALLSAHIGCYELSGYTLRPEGKQIFALVFAHETAVVAEGRQSQFDQTCVRMVPIADDMSHLFLLSEALAQGHIVSFPADRHLPAERTLEVPFFRGKASLPHGPFALIARRKLPTLVLSAMKTSTHHYRLFVDPLPMPEPSLPMAQRAEALATAYAAVLQQRVTQYPAQWFNFFPFVH